MIPGPGLMSCGGDGSGGVKSGDMISRRLIVPLVGGSCWEEETGFSFLLLSRVAGHWQDWRRAADPMHTYHTNYFIPDKNHQGTASDLPLVFQEPRHFFM